MHRSLAIAGLLAALVVCAAPARAFQETPTPPAPEEGAAKPKSNMAPMQLGSPATATDKPDDRKGFNVFGYRVFPKLDFGLDLLYGDKQPQAELQQDQIEGSSPKDDGDVSLLGKLKRRF